MKIFKNFFNSSPKTPLALSIGMFDGVHLGHQSILKKLNIVATQNGWQSAVLTFWPHPRTFFNPQDQLKFLNTLKEKEYFLDKHGLQNLFLKKFDDDFRNLTGEEFVKKILVEELNVKHLIIGYDHTFGKNKSGDFSLLQKMAPEYGFTVEQVQAVDYHHTHISSTKVREALQSGNIIAASEMLGYHYSLCGRVIHGKKIGRQIGFPTANIEIDPQKIVPKNGAYIVEVFVKNKQYPGMLSIGTNPTVEGTKLSVEVNILDFDQDIYGEKICVNFRDFLHEEIKFESLEKLIEKLEQDKELTEGFLF